MKIQFTVPDLFVSVNQMYGSNYGRQYLTKDANNYKGLVAQMARLSYGGVPTEKPVKVEIYYYFGNKRRKDIQNDKCTFDALEGIIYIDDKQIEKLTIHKKFDKKNPRTEITVII